MQTKKEDLLAQIEARSLREAEILAGEFARAAEKERENILKGIRHEQWLAATCRDALNHHRP